MTNDPLDTPIYHKTDPGDGPRDGEPCYFVLARSGLFIGRNTEFFQSLVPARRWPAGLCDQQPFLKLRLPRVPADLLAQVTAFFRRVALEHGAEAMTLLVLDRATGRIHPFVPPQVGTIGHSWNGSVYPIGLHYESPYLDAQRHLVVGDIHSHAREPAYASGTDVADERFRTGLHVIAGRVDRATPDWHAQYVVDGTRFTLAPETVLDLEGMQQHRAAFPTRWLRRLRVEEPWRSSVGKWP
jgi:hypothetical protein